MSKAVGIGHQDFETIRENRLFYVDKTRFIKEWWEKNDEVTLIARPRRFGKTLSMSMMEKFFSIDYAGRSDLFAGLFIWEEEKYRRLQGSFPVISISFANIKERDYTSTVQKICQVMVELYNDSRFLLEGDLLSEEERKYFKGICMDMPEVTATMAIHRLSKFLYRHYGKKVIILLDEYDTPMQEAYVNGYWDKLSDFIRSLFNATFKTNPHLERAIMTGITRVSKESIFSDLNNLEVVTTTSEKYADCLGFTEEEVFRALDEFDLSSEKEKVKSWYDGFCFGEKREIYNPWSILNYLDKRKLAPYWANTSSNGLVGKLLREGNREVKQDFEVLLSGGCLVAEIDEQIAYDQLEASEASVWSLLLASGYLKVVGYEECEETEHGLSAPKYELELTNLEVRLMFRSMIAGWFRRNMSDYNDFIKALLLDDVDAMNHYMNRVALSMFSYFDTGKRPSGEEPERFYHGFVLGLMVELSDRYALTSNRESGFGRYDVMLEPRNQKEDAIILEFKVQSKREKDLSDTVKAALEQIDAMGYEEALTAKGFSREKIRKYGFAFRGKEVLIG